ncbi:hypothetical protein [Actinophytocola sp. KF-1]
MRHEMRAGRGQGEKTAVMASVSVLAAGQSPATPRGEAADMSGTDLVPADLLAVWEDIYRDYLATSHLIDSGDPGKGQVLSQLSARLASTWRRIAEAMPGGEWCLRAALLTAAEAMEHQAGDWDRRRRLR